MKKLLFISLQVLVPLGWLVAQTVIKMEHKNGVYYLPCKVNDVPLKMIFDTGASDVTIALPEAIVMYRNGTLTDDDIIGTSHYQIANGDISEGTAIILRTVQLGPLILYNVKANVVHKMNAPLLLGQSVLSRLGSVNINYAAKTLTITASPGNNEEVFNDRPGLDVIPNMPLNGLFKYGTSLKSNFTNIPMFGIVNDEVAVIKRIQKLDDINVIDDSNPTWLLININGKVGVVERIFLKPKL